MGNVQGQHGDHTRKHSEAGHGLVFNGNQREMSPFDPVSFEILSLDKLEFFRQLEMVHPKSKQQKNSREIKTR